MNIPLFLVHAFTTERFQGNASFYTGLYRIVMNLSIDHVRRAKKKRKKAAAELGLPSFYTFQNVKRLKEALRNDAVEAEGAAQRRDAARRAAERMARDDVV